MRVLLGVGMKAMLLGVILVAGTAVAQVPGVTDPAATARPVLPVPSDPKLPSLILVGDSTVRNGRGDGGRGQWGWGEPLVSFFDTTKINVVNRAIGGRSSKSYISEGEWDKTLAYLKPGDVVLFQWDITIAANRMSRRGRELLCRAWARRRWRLTT